MDLSNMMVGALLLVMTGAVIGFILGMAFGPRVKKMFSGNQNVQEAQVSSEKSTNNTQTEQQPSQQQPRGQQNGNGSNGNKNGRNLKHGQNRNGQNVNLKEDTKPNNDEKAEELNAVQIENIVSSAVTKQMNAFMTELKQELIELEKRLIKLVSEEKPQTEYVKSTSVSDPTVKQSVDATPKKPEEPEIQAVAPPQNAIKKYVQLSVDDKTLREDNSLEYCVYFISTESLNSTSGELFIREDLSQEKITDINNFRFRYLGDWVCRIITDCGTPKSMKTLKPGRVVKKDFDWVVESPVEIELS